MNKKSKLWLFFLLFFVVAKFFLGKFIFIGCLSHYISFEHIKEQSMIFKEFVDLHYVRSLFLYIFLYAGVIAIGIPGVAPLSLLGGFLFGIIPSTIYGTAGATIGSIASFGLFRYVFRSAVQQRYGKQLKAFNDQMLRYGANYLLMVHFASIIPFFFINTLAALSNISWKTFIWTTIVGFIPLAMIYSYAGRQLSLITSPHDILSAGIIAILIILVLLALLPIIIKHFRHEHE